MRYMVDIQQSNLLAAPSLAGHLLIIPAGSAVIALDAGDGRKVWTYSVSGASFPAEVAYASGTIFVVSGNDGILRAIRAADGVELWTLSVTPTGAWAAARSWSAPAIANGSVFYTASLKNAKGGYEGHLVAVALPGPGAMPGAAVVSIEDVGETTESPSIANSTIVVGRVAYGMPEAVQLSLTAPNDVTVGELFTFQVVAMREDGIPDFGFSGDIELSCTDPNAAGSTRRVRWRSGGTLGTGPASGARSRSMSTRILARSTNCWCRLHRWCHRGSVSL
jgi:hypothetical protein